MSERTFSVLAPLNNNNFFLIIVSDPFSPFDPLSEGTYSSSLPSFRILFLTFPSVSTDFLNFLLEFFLGLLTNFNVILGESLSLFFVPSSKSEEVLTHSKPSTNQIIKIFFFFVLRYCTTSAILSRLTGGFIYGFLSRGSFFAVVPRPI